MLTTLLCFLFKPEGEVVEAEIQKAGYEAEKTDPGVYALLG